MRFLTPYALSLLPLSAVPFFLSRLRPQRTAVVSTFLWREGDVMQSAHSWSRLRRHWRAFVQAAVIAATVGALARPDMTWRSRRIALVLDVSASMGARDDGRTRLDSARERASRMLDSLPRTARVTLFAAKRTPLRIGEFAADGPAVRAAMSALRPTGGSADIGDALRAARAVAAEQDVVVISDGGPPSDVDPGRTRWLVVGVPADNVAISAFAVRRVPSSPDNAQALVEISNYGRSERSLPLDITEDNRPVLHETVHVKPQSTTAIVRDLPQVGRILAATIAADDALDVDNQRFAVVPEARPIRARLLSNVDYFLEHALTANPALRLARASDRPAAGDDSDVVVCEGCSTVPAGRSGVVLVASTAADERSAPVALTMSQPAHPLAQGLDLSGSMATPLNGPALPLGHFDIVARAGERPAILAGRLDGRRIVAVNLDLRASAFPLTTAFPLLIANAIDWAAGADEAPLNIVSGDLLSWRVRGDQPSYEVVGPNAVKLPARQVNDRIMVADTDMPGIYRIRERGSERQVAVNAAADSESDLRAVAASSPLDSAPADVQETTELAPYLLIGAIILFAADWYLSGASTDRSAIVWRTSVAAAFALGAAGVSIPTFRGGATVIFAVDRSDSISVRAQQQAIARINGIMGAMRGDDLAGLVAFGADAALERRPAPPSPVTAATSTIPTSGTNIERALRVARSAMPGDGDRHIVLVSDGRETTGRAALEAARAGAEGIRIDVIPADQMDERLRTARVRRVDVPEEARLGEPYRVAVEIEGPPRTTATVVIETGLDRVERRVDIPAEGVAVATLIQSADEGGVRTYRAAAVEADGERQPSWVGGSVTVSGRPALLYVASSPGQVAPDLEAGGFSVEAASAASMPTNSGALAAFDGVVLDDVPSEALSAGQLTALSQYVTQAGGGLLLLGSPRALELAGYPQTPIGRLLPIDLRPRNGRRAPPVAFVVIFDKSGSMADRVDGVQKIELARQAVLKMLDVVPPTDSVGIVSFDAKPLVVAPLASGQNAAAIAERLRGIEAGGSTAIAPAVDLAETWLRRSSFARRHVLLLSDGRTSPSDAEKLRAIARGKPFELSVVAIGPDADRSFLRTIAEQTGGRAYFPDELRQLPRIVARDAARAAGGTVVEEPFKVRAAEGHPVLSGIDRAALPQLGGYVVAANQPGADSILTSHLDDPILSGWRVGLGRVAVFTSDLRTAWGAPLSKWGGHGQLWTQTMRWVARHTSNRLLHATVTPTDGGVQLVVEAERRDETFAELGRARVTVRTPGGSAMDVPLRPTAPGRYSARIATDREGAYQMAVSATDEPSGEDLTLLKGFYWTNEREGAERGSDMALLADLAQMTGGRVLRPAANLLDDGRLAGKYGLSPALEMAGLTLFIAGLAWRRQWRFHALKRIVDPGAPGAPVPGPRLS